MADKKANLRVDNYSISELKTILGKIDKEMIAIQNVFDVKSLKVDGHDVMRVLNIKQGKEVGDILKSLFEHVLVDPELNKRYILIDLIKEV